MKSQHRSAKYIRLQAKHLLSELKRLMRKKKISQEYIARRSGLPAQIINRTLKDQSPTIGAVAAIADALGYKIKLVLTPKFPIRRKKRKH